jgi:hypothetical protein
MKIHRKQIGLAQIQKEYLMKRSYFFTSVTYVLVILISLSCALVSSVAEKPAAGQPTDVAPANDQSSLPETQPTEAPVVTDCASAPPSDYSGPAPQEGTSNLYGLLQWNGTPVADLVIQACASANYKNECEQPIFAATSDSNGAFVITDIPPGEYEVVVHAINQEKWLDVSNLTDDYSTVEIGADQCHSAGDINLIKYDLFQKNPPNNAKLNEPRPILTWDAYPDAAYYELYWGAEEGQAVYAYERVDTNQVTPQMDISNCRYSWKVTAFNAQSIAIAETEEFFNFYVLNQPLSCYIVNNQPASNSVVSGENLILSWDKHPLADHYQITMVLSDPEYKKILDYIEVTEPTYALEIILEPGDYYWNVYAIDQFGNTVAGDEGNTYLTVK